MITAWAAEAAGVAIQSRRASNSTLIGRGDGNGTVQHYEGICSLRTLMNLNGCRSRIGLLVGAKFVMEFVVELRT